MFLCLIIFVVKTFLGQFVQSLQKSEKPADSRAGRVALPVVPPLHSCADPLLGKMLLMLFDWQAQSVGWQLSTSAPGRDQPLPTVRDRKSFIKLTANIL